MPRALPVRYGGLGGNETVREVEEGVSYTDVAFVVS